MAYCAQQPWVIAGSLKSNVLFGAPYDPARYQVTLRRGCYPGLTQRQRLNSRLALSNAIDGSTSARLGGPQKHSHAFTSTSGRRSRERASACRLTLAAPATCVRNDPPIERNLDLQQPLRGFRMSTLLS